MYRYPLAMALILATLVAAATACGPASAPAVPAEEKPRATATPAAAKPAMGELTEAVLKNAKYQLPDLGAFQLTEGRYEQKYGEGATQVNRAGFQAASLGDLNNDGAGDAAVILWWNSGGSGTFVYLLAVVNKDGAPQQVAAELLGDRVKTQSLSIENGKIAVGMVGFGPNDPLCCPSQELTRTYRLAADALKLAP